MKVDILGVKVNSINLYQSTQLVDQWITEKKKKHFIVTPNIEFIMAARADASFKKVLNEADLAIPDSARLGWAYDQLNEKNILFKALKWPFFIFPTILPRKQLDIVSGVDLMETLIKLSLKKTYTIGLLGGKENVAIKLKECLIRKYPKLKIVFASSDVVVDSNGEPTSLQKLQIPTVDILFVAFGHIKQEKWIYHNLPKQPIWVCMGVGGAFDYLSGSIPRAPEILRSLGFEWLFRLVNQPWRIKRFGSLVKFVFLVLLTSAKA